MPGCGLGICFGLFFGFLCLWVLFLFLYFAHRSGALPHGHGHLLMHKSVIYSGDWSTSIKKSLYTFGTFRLSQLKEARSSAVLALADWYCQDFWGPQPGIMGYSLIRTNQETGHSPRRLPNMISA